MKTKIVLVFSAIVLMLSAGCKRDNISSIQVFFSDKAGEGVADANGDYTFRGHISSNVSLSQVTLTKQGDAEVFMVDETTAKNKNEYDFSYQVSGITANTSIIMDVYDQIGGKYSTQFFIIK